MDYIKSPREIDERVRRIDPEGVLIFSELAKAQDPIATQAVEFALETGCRRSEQLRVDWKDYRAGEGTIVCMSDRRRVQRVHYWPIRLPPAAPECRSRIA